MQSPGLLMTVVHQFEASAEGTYSIEIIWDEEHKKSVAIRVVLVEP